MFYMSISIVFLSTFFISLIIWKLWNKNFGVPANLPPCLPTFPFLGTLPYMPDIGKLHLFFMEKSKKYGNVFSLYLLNRFVVVINGREAIHEALVKRGLDFASRPEQYLNRYFNSETRGIIQHKYDEHFRKFHAMSLNILKQFGFGKNDLMERRIQFEVEDLLKHIDLHGSEPFDPERLITSSVSNVIVSIIFGKRRNLDDPMLSDILEIVHSSVRNIDIPMTVNLFPILRFLPKYKKGMSKVKSDILTTAIFYTDQIRECMEDIEEDGESEETGMEVKTVKIKKSKLKIEDFTSPIEVLSSNRPDFTKSDSKKRLSGDRKNSFVAYFYEQIGNSYEEYEQLYFTIRDLFLAGTETTATTLRWFLVVMANNPDIQTRLQNEIDSVIIRESSAHANQSSLRLPSLEDRPYLPSMEAAILELLRYKTLVPMGLPHCTIKDTHIFGGLSIPVDTLIMVNLYSANMEFENPEEYNIDRFLDSTKQTVINKDKVLTFSLGKRSCLGEILARQELFLYTTALLQLYRILPPEGQSTIDVQDIMTVILSPSSYRVRLEKR